MTSVVLANACNDKLWRTDPHVAAAKTKSVLCIPFARQGNLEAILYLEYVYFVLFYFFIVFYYKFIFTVLLMNLYRNNLTEGAFTTDLVNVLNLLASQAAISIQNANMFTHMQRAKEQAQHAIQAQRYHLSSSSFIISF